MAKRIYTHEEVRGWAQEVVDAAGEDHCYFPQNGGACAYLHYTDDPDVFTPGCLIGHILLKYTHLTENDLLKVNKDSINRITKYVDIQFTPKAWAWMVRAQSAQDDFMEWGMALTRADLMIQDRGWDRNENLIEERVYNGARW